jgi:hypothetical protein
MGGDARKEGPVNIGFSCGRRAGDETEARKLLLQNRKRAGGGVFPSAGAGGGTGHERHNLCGTISAFCYPCAINRE